MPIPLPEFSAFCSRVKEAGLLTETPKRPKVEGMKMPRVYTPRLGTGNPGGGAPANPYRVNWQKLGGVGHKLLGTAVLGTAGVTAVNTGKAALDKTTPPTTLGAPASVRGARRLMPAHPARLAQPSGEFR